MFLRIFFIKNKIICLYKDMITKYIVNKTDFDHYILDK